MKGVIFAAGLGTRLYPLTKDRPKALVEVHGKTMLEYTLERMREAGIRDVTVNVHAFAGKVEAFLDGYSALHPDLTLHVSDERELLLETGGGLKKMRPLLDEPFLVHNVDVLSDIDFGLLAEAAGWKGAISLEDPASAGVRFSGTAGAEPQTTPLAVLAVRKTVSDRCFLFNDAGLLCGWENIRTGEKKISRPLEQPVHRFGFTGIHLIRPEIFALMSEEGIFSITDVYLRLAQKHAIRMVDVSDASWFDIGSPEQLAEAERLFGR